MVDVVDVRRDTPAPEPSRAAVPSAWAPLLHTWFRALWIAQFVANTGTWAQTVGAQWLMSRQAHRRWARQTMGAR